jgi:hypothetical protein
MLEETKRILYQRTQNGWINKSIYTLKLLQKQLKYSRKFNALQVYVVVENVENLDVGWCVCICVCLCVRVVLPDIMRVSFLICLGGEKLTFSHVSV